MDVGASIIIVQNKQNGQAHSSFGITSHCSINETVLRSDVCCWLSHSYYV